MCIVVEYYTDDKGNYQRHIAGGFSTNYSRSKADLPRFLFDVYSFGPSDFHAKAAVMKSIRERRISIRWR